MNAIFYICVCISLFSELALSVYVSDLKPDVNCKAILATKERERMKDPSIVSNIGSVK